MIEKTLVLLKPDAVQRSLVGQILTRFERVGLKIVAMKLSYADEDMAGEHYQDDDEWLKSVGEKTLAAYKAKGVDLGRTALEQGQWVREQLKKYIKSSPVVAVVLEGHNAVKLVRKLVGPTAPADAPPGTIRGDFSFETYTMADKLGRPLYNLIHASDSSSEAEREIAVWFNEDEIHVWQRFDEPYVYKDHAK